MGADLIPNLIIPSFFFPSVNLDQLHARNHFLFYGIRSMRAVPYLIDIISVEHMDSKERTYLV